MGGQLKPSNVVKTEPEVLEIRAYAYGTISTFENIPNNVMGFILNVIEKPNYFFIYDCSFTVYNSVYENSTINKAMKCYKNGTSESEINFANNTFQFNSSNGVISYRIGFDYGENYEVNPFLGYTKATSYLIYQDY